ncbi:MAG TPA: grasp-with-spasm system ATP-grasp peptide maturase [Thermoanaerobaculia bacterium]
MILIFSQSALEPTTEEVMDWVEALGGRCVRLNGDDVEGRSEIRIEIVDGRLALRFASEGIELPLQEAGAVWYRRWLYERRHETVDLLADPGADDHTLHHQLRRHLTLESRRLSDLLFSSFDHLPWLSHPRRSNLNKLDVLRRAAREGIATPATLVTTEREALRRFAARYGGEVITKPIGEVEAFIAGEVSHFLYTTLLGEAEIAALPERFAPSLFQERIEKAYELRVFYLDGELHAMAIFSQGDPQTRADFRQYNRERPNRNVPYRLRPDLAERLLRLMQGLELETGSLDLLVTPDGREVFLEVNPVGQLGMVSHPCNYQLERKIAQLLLRKEDHGRRP